MQVFKFGGASVKDAASIKNVATIIANYKVNDLLVVVSAIGKSTDKLVEITKQYHQQTGRAFELLEQFKQEHLSLLEELFADPAHPIYTDIINTFVEIEWVLEEEPLDTYDYLFDQIVSLGELLSTKIVAAYVSSQGIATQWVDARSYIFTDNTYREAQVDWEKTSEKICRDLPKLLSNNIVITQGFIGSTSENFTTTLGREGSDYSAAIFAACLDAQDITIWKDVPGVLNADPKWFDRTELIPELSYRDAIELTYYGATVIHPKTIKPLENKKIPLNVKSFLDPDSQGTQIKTTNQGLPVPSFIFKVNQLLINIHPRDFSFIVEDNLSHIFNLFHQYRIKINMMHNSAISFSVSVDDTGENVQALLADLEQRYTIAIEPNLELITIRYFNQETIDRVLVDKRIMAELKDSYTCQLLVKNI